MTGPSPPGPGQKPRRSAPDDSISGTRSKAQVETLGRYRLASQIASGGMATVFLATVSGPGGFEKIVALKRIHPHLAEETDFVDMFLDEARIASRIHHANVCQVFDFGEADGTYYIAMEFLLGDSLARIMKTIRKLEGEFESPRHLLLATKVVADACEGLHAAHELRGRDGQLLHVVHRDVSPQNLFVTYDGNIKVVDFGIASASDRVHHTAAGQVKGKFSYMAPEQSRGKKIDRRADVWALGVVLWELLTLRRLFRRETTVETLTAMLNDDIPPPSKYNPNISPELDAICMKALARDPDARYLNARDFGRDLVRFAGSTGHPAGMADLAEWMDRLFPEARARAYERIEAAQRGEYESTTVTPVSMEVSESEIQEVDANRLARNPDTVPEQHLPAPDDENIPTVAMDTGAFAARSSAAAAATLKIASAPADRRRNMAILLVGLAGLLVIAGLLGVIVALTGGGPGSSAEATEPAGPGVAIAAPAGAIDPPAGDPRPADPAPADPPPQVDPPVPVEGPVAAGGAAAPDPATAEGGTKRRVLGRRLPRGASAQESSMDSATTREGGSTAQSAASGEPGRVVIFTPGGWANVYDEAGRFLGQSPTTVMLPAGVHRLQLRPFGQPPARRVRVDVPAGGTTRLVQTVGGDETQ